MKRFYNLLLIIIFTTFTTSCGPSFCECVWDQTTNDEACRRLYKLHFGTEYPSFERKEAARKGSCSEYGKKVTKRLKDAGY